MTLDLKRIGGSDIGPIFGISPYAGPLSVYMRIVEGVEREEVAPMKRGHALEKSVLQWYADNHADDLQPNVSVLGLREHERATLDAIAYHGERSRVVEAKTASWRVMSQWGEPGTDAVPEPYLLQVQWYMGAIRQDPRVRDSADDVADIPALVGGEFGLWQVKYDAELYEGLREGVARFWRDHVVARRPPEPTALANDADAIRKRYRTPTRPVLHWAALTDEQRAVVEQWQSIRGDFDAQEAREALLTMRLKALLGDAEGLVGLPDGSRITWRQNKPRQVTDWERAAREAFGASEYRGDVDEWNRLVERNTTTKDGARPLVWRGGAKR